ncbi:MAG: nucleoside triphosphate pyrophosphohydrolase [Fibrobacteres bacterium]|nr:nucleoside triphosphate pyrophosphohydrolase [Fibrobacterota bacterium]
MPSYTLSDLLAIMARLRAPDGCPWDRKQTHASLLNYLIEESYEFIDAVEAGDKANMSEELGDVLLQVVFHAQLAQEAGDFDFAAVVQGIADKLVRRHPHVFGEMKLADAEAVEVKWAELKRAEKQTGEAAAADAKPEGGLGEVPKHLPALLKAEKLQKRAAVHGFDWPDWKGPAAKIREELIELEAEANALDRDPDRIEDEFGDLLFAAVNLGRFFKLDPERALARANRKFISRYGKMEAMAKGEGKDFGSLPLDEKEAYWVRTKEEERKGTG